MRIVDIKVTDTFGTKEARFTAKSINRITGPNGSGKSSIINALRKCFDGGSDPSIIRNGAEKSVIEFTIEDGTKFTRTCAPVKRRKGDDGQAPRFKTDLEVLQPDGTPRPAPQTYLTELASAQAVDPGKILKLDVATAIGKKQLAETLLAIMPIRFTAEEISTICRKRAPLTATDQHGNPMPDTRPPVDMQLPAIAAPFLDLDGLKKYHAAVTEQRRRVGQVRDDADGAVNRGRATLPEDDGSDYGAELKAARADEKALQEAISADTLAIARDRADAEVEQERQHSVAQVAVNADIDAKIKALEVERAKRLVECQQQHDQNTLLIRRLEREALDELSTKNAPALKAIAEKIGQLAERIEGQQRAKFIREQIEENLATYRTKEREYIELSGVLERLESLRKTKLDSLPVAGLEVAGDDVLVNGVPWPHVNTAKRVEIAVQLCTLMGEPGPLFVDDAEHLDCETREMLENGLAEAGFQLFEAIVSDEGGLRIEALDPVAA